MEPFSYSKYSALHRCGRYFDLTYNKKLPQPKQTHFEFGSALHSGLRTLLEERDLDHSQDVFETFWRLSKDLDFKGERNDHATLNTMGLKYLKNFNTRYVPKMWLLAAETRLKDTFKSNIFPQGIPCEGTPDALVRWSGKNVLLDYKTSAYNYLPEKSELTLQLNFYAWLLTTAGFKVDQMCYFVFEKYKGNIQTPYIIDYNHDKAVDLIQETMLYWERNKDFSERNITQCIIGKQICPYFKECKK